ncbi:conserved domain protein, partial [Acinetobacter baumannii 6013150]
MEIKKILKLKMIKKLPFNNNNLINKKFQKILKISINFHNIYSVSLIQNKDRSEERFSRN